MQARVLSLTALAGALLLAGCANNPYLDAKRRTAAGGELDQQEAAARRDLDAEQRRRAAITTQKADVDAQIQRNSQRIASLEKDLRAQDRQLADALKSRKIDKTRHDDLKRQLEDLRADTQRADLDNQRDGMSKTPTSGDAAKQAQLAELEKRKKALEDALGALTKR